MDPVGFYMDSRCFLNSEPYWIHSSSNGPKVDPSDSEADPFDQGVSPFDSDSDVDSSSIALKEGVSSLIPHPQVSTQAAEASCRLHLSLALSSVSFSGSGLTVTPASPLAANSTCPQLSDMEDVPDSPRGFAIGNYFRDLQPGETYSHRSELNWVPTALRNWVRRAQVVDRVEAGVGHFELEEAGYVHEVNIFRHSHWGPGNPIERPSMVIQGYGNAEDKDQWFVKKFWASECVILWSM
ncbi:hypothetical protein TorRG33x02_191910 [Trema orientale]|uniref:Uncharacterized protein n=1 Tax=Trema orientale TaxID=63057 RepID=A0A2P5EHD9_TREOI|nr:hypothetical protein TorRG33x02_191910 [Trema orientale]